MTSARLPIMPLGENQNNGNLARIQSHFVGGMLKCFLYPDSSDVST